MLSVEEINKLKAENYELKESLKVFHKPDIIKLLTDYRTGELDLQINKYKQTLQEIKEIAENVCRDDCPDLKNGYCIGLGECSFRARKKIIDLITKAESEG